MLEPYRPEVDGTLLQYIHNHIILISSLILEAYEYGKQLPTTFTRSPQRVTTLMADLAGFTIALLSYCPEELSKIPVAAKEAKLELYTAV